MISDSIEGGSLELIYWMSWCCQGVAGPCGTDRTKIGSFETHYVIHVNDDCNMGLTLAVNLRFVSLEVS